MWPPLSFICASICVSTIAGLATAPPYEPECRSVLLPRTSIWKYARPRSPKQIDGTSRSNIGESEMTTTSAFRRSVFAAMKSSRFALPTSSSPSSITLTLIGRRADSASGSPRWP